VELGAHLRRCVFDLDGLDKRRFPLDQPAQKFPPWSSREEGKLYTGDVFLVRPPF